MRNSVSDVTDAEILDETREAMTQAAFDAADEASAAETVESATENLPAFDELGLSDEMLRAIENLGYTAPTPVQAGSIPVVLEGRDLLAAAQTGTGKTAAFLLPTMNNLEHIAPPKPVRERGGRNRRRGAKKPEGNGRGPVMLVITPTRELAQQIDEVAGKIADVTGHVAVTVVGGVSYKPQTAALKYGCDILVATPGRLVDLIEQGACHLDEVKVLVLDEADRMLDMGFLPAVRRIVRETPAERQTLLFSATLDEEAVGEITDLVSDPARVEITPATSTADTVDQFVFPVSIEAKNNLLPEFLKKEGPERTIVFMRTKHRADSCCRRLERKGIKAAAIHGNRSQAQRERALSAFRDGTVDVLVATDVLARGIDISDVRYVVNFDVPAEPTDYIHRIGRTGRAGKQGTAITFVSPSEFRGLNNLMRDIKVEIKRETLPSPQDIVEMKRLKIKEEMQEIVENESYDGYKEFAEELLAEYTPDIALGALLRLAFRSELDQNNYPEIRSFSVDRKGTARLFLAVGKRDGYTARKLVDMLKFKCGLRDKYINDVQISDNFSFVSVPFHDAEEIVRKLNRLNRGRRPIAEIARDGEEAAARKPRRAKTADAGGEEYAPAPKKSVRREKPAAPAQTAPAAGDESAAPRRKLKTKIQTEPRPEIPDFSKMSNEGFDWSAFMKFDEGTAWGRDENGKGKGKATKSVRKTPKKTVTAAQRVAAKGRKRK